MRSIQLSLLALASLLLGGCANFTSPTQTNVLEQGKPYYMSTDASRRGAVVYPLSTGIKVCAEPSPDVAMNLVSKLDLKLEKTGIGTVDAGADVTANVVKLAERGQMVMFLRESLYRLCEVSLNQQLTSEQVLQTYNAALKLATDLAKIEQTKAETANAKATTIQRMVNEGKSISEIKEVVKY